MSASAVFDFLYAWANRVLNTKYGLGVTIIESHQNAPAPEKSDPYIVIDYAGDRTKIGTPGKGGVDGGTGERNLVNDYSLTIELWEVNGDGDKLRILIDSLETQQEKEEWYKAGYSHYSEGPIRNMPRLAETKFTRECLVEMVIGVAEETVENVGFIGQTDGEGTIPAQGRSGNHTIDTAITT